MARIFIYEVIERRLARVGGVVRYFEIIIIKLGYHIEHRRRSAAKGGAAIAKQLRLEAGGKPLGIGRFWVGYAKLVSQVKDALHEAHRRMVGWRRHGAYGVEHGGFQIHPVGVGHERVER